MALAAGRSLPGRMTAATHQGTRGIFLCFASLLALLLVPITTNIIIITTTTTYYVAPTGSDGNPGTQAAPFRTIKKAASVVKPGSTVHVAPGTYAESIITTVSGTASARIRYVSDTKWGAKIVPIQGATEMWRADGGYTDIDGFEFDGKNSTSIIEGVFLTGGNSAVMNNHVHHIAENSVCNGQGGAGLNADQGRGAAFNNYDFTGNVVHNIGGSCGYFHGIYQSSSGTVKNNLIYANAQGIRMGHDAHNVKTINNTVFSSFGTGIEYGGCDGAYTSNNCPFVGIAIHNNIVYDNGIGIDGPVAAYDSRSNTFHNNIIFRNTIDFRISSVALPQVVGTVTADPQFINYIRAGGGDYRLKITSPAIDKGLATYAPSIDIDGIARPRGKGIDTGAYEY